MSTTKELTLKEQDLIYLINKCKSGSVKLILSDTEDAISNRILRECCSSNSFKYVYNNFTTKMQRRKFEPKLNIGIENFLFLLEQEEFDINGKWISEYIFNCLDVEEIGTTF